MTSLVGRAFAADKASLVYSDQRRRQFIPPRSSMPGPIAARVRSSPAVAPTRRPLDKVDHPPQDGPLVRSGLPGTRCSTLMNALKRCPRALGGGSPNLARVLL